MMTGLVTMMTMPYLHLCYFCSHAIFSAVLYLQLHYICSCVLFTGKKELPQHVQEATTVLLRPLFVLIENMRKMNISESCTSIHIGHLFCSLFEEILSWNTRKKISFSPAWTLMTMMRPSNWKTNSVALTSLIIKWMSVYHLGRACEDFLTPND